MLFIYLPKCEGSDGKNFGEEATKAILGEYFIRKLTMNNIITYVFILLFVKLICIFPIKNPHI
jgi:hypothetical protein